MQPKKLFYKYYFRLEMIMRGATPSQEQIFELLQPPPKLVGSCEIYQN